MTTSQAQRTEAMMKEYAGEDVYLGEIDSTLYVFGSELATLRIFAKYNANGSAHNLATRVGFSKNMDSFYFSLERSIS